MAMDKTFDAKAAEPKITQKWHDADAFKAGANAKPGAAPYCVMIPPPNVTGVLHIGHAFNNTLQDILIRWKRMQGFDTLWQAGVDHAGIATQMVVERQLAQDGIKRTDLSRKDFTAKIWAWKEQSGGKIIHQLQRLGASCDWSRCAFTMAGAPGDTRVGHENSPNFHDAVIKTFVDFYEKGLIYRGKRLVNWDPHFQTAISDLEVENIETAGHMWHFKYPLADGASYEYVQKDADGTVTLREQRDYIAIATTRPETMLGDGAIAVHPDDERYTPIVGMLCEIPVGPKEHRRLIPIITDHYPDPEFGSGAVKITGAHDFNDYQVAKRGNIPMYRLMDTKGAMRNDGAVYAQAAQLALSVAKGEKQLDEEETDLINLVPDDLRGLDRFEARKRVIEQITTEGLAVMVEGDDGLIPLIENKPIMQPFGDRSKVVIEPMLTDQWFVDAEKIVTPALDCVRNGRVKIMPESGEKTYYHWLKNIEPWCISRQLWWGHQVPVWYDEAGNQYCAPNEQAAQAQAGEGVTLTRDPDVLDTWFSSGLWPLGTLGWPENTTELEKYFPTSTLITGQDILFFWVARMIMMQLAMVDQVPFDTVYLHGLVRDSKGKKMSKSTGNVIDPLEIIDDYGADALRFTNAAMASLGGALKMDESRIAGYRNFGTKLWNAARFAEFNTAYPQTGFDPETVIQPLNKWIIGELARTRIAVDSALEQFRFNDVASTLYHFIWNKLCDWYVELSKPLLQGDDAAIIAETKATLGFIIQQSLILLHPIMPFMSETLWEEFGDTDLLAHRDWPTYGGELIDETADQDVNWVINLIEQIRSVRAELRVNAGAKIPLQILDFDTRAQARFDNNKAMIMRLARIETVSTIKQASKGAISIALEGAQICLPLADIIDLDAERARLQKAIAKLQKELTDLQAKLDNPTFIANAPKTVVQDNRTRLNSGSIELKQLNAALERLASLEM